MELREYQKQIATEGVSILKKHKILILSMMVRTGKTITAMEVARRVGARKVLFVTKKKAIRSIESDWAAFRPGFSIVVINYESLHKIPNKGFDLVIADESHSFGAFPKPSKRTKTMRDYVGSKPLILLSGTLTPESYSQIYHQLWLSKHSPWNQYRNFYAWARDYVNVYERWIAGNPRKFYDKAIKKKVFKDIEHLVISFTQEEAGFTSLVEEEVIWIDMPEQIRDIYSEINKEGVYFQEDWSVSVSGAADKINKLSQLCGGTLITDDGSFVLDNNKAVKLRELFRDHRKVAVFYKYQAEFKLLRDWLVDYTTSPEDFNRRLPKKYVDRGLGSELGPKYFLGQIQSVREGINLKSADCIVMYNIDFSATSYWQARARLQSKDREDPAKVYWLFYKGGIESYVYEAVQKKKNFTSSYYRKVQKLNQFI